MESWLVSIPVEGHPLPENESDYIKCDKVIFHQYNDPCPEYGNRLVASIIVQGKHDTVKSEAIELIENALTKLIFTSGLALKLNDNDYYLTPQKESSISQIPRIDAEAEGFKHRFSKTGNFWYKVGEDDTKSILSKIELLKPENQENFNTALKHYRVAICSLNPFQAIEAYFACITILTKEILNIEKKVKKPHIRKALKENLIRIPKDFDRDFDTYWDKDRMTAAHGSLDILDPVQMEEAQKHALNLKQWTRQFLINYLNNNQINI